MCVCGGGGGGCLEKGGSSDFQLKHGRRLSVIDEGYKMAMPLREKTTRKTTRSPLLIEDKKLGSCMALLIGSEIYSVLWWGWTAVAI